MEGPELRGRRVVLYALVLLFTLQAAFPFAWGLITTFKSSPDLYSRDNNPFLFNEPPTLDHVKLLFQQSAFGTFVGNRIVVSLCVVAITLLVAATIGTVIGLIAGYMGGWQEYVRGVGWGAFAMMRPGYMQEQWRALVPMMESGVVDPPIGTAYPLEEVRTALTDLAERRSTGKSVLTLR